MKKTLAKALAWMLIACMLCTMAFAAGGQKLIVNGIDTEQTSYVKSNTTYVPVRSVMEGLGYEVTWDGEKNEVGLIGADQTVTLNTVSETATRNGVSVPISDIILTEGTTYVPLAFLQRYCGVASETEERTNRLYLYGSGKIEPFITATYPIVVVPGTLSCWSSVDFDALKENVMKDSGNSFAGVALALVRPVLITMLEGIQSLEKSVESYYITETNGKIFYVEPFWDTYVPLFTYFESNGLRQDEDYFIFGYDTLNVSIEDNALQLKDYIASVKERTGAEQVQIIAHSQGGLITRQYIQENGGHTSVARFMGVGVPNEGVSYTYPLYERGSFNPLDGREMLISILAYFAYGDFSDASKMQLVHENTKSIVQMLPTYIDMGELENTFLEKLNRTANLKKLDRIGRENILLLAGSGVNTIADYDANGRTVYSYDGDSTVLVASALLDGYHYGLLPETRHTELFRAESELYRYIDLRVK